jgi:Flp pilus assembly pilin Flp
LVRRPITTGDDCRAKNAGSLSAHVKFPMRIVQSQVTGLIWIRRGRAARLGRATGRRRRTRLHSCPRRPNRFGTRAGGLRTVRRERRYGRLTRETIMKAMKNLVAKLVRDEQGGEVLEYALIAGLIVVASIAVIGTIGTKVLARWGSLNSSM